MKKEDILKAIKRVEETDGDIGKERLFKEGLEEEHKQAKKLEKRRDKKLIDMLEDKSLIKKLTGN